MNKSARNELARMLTESRPVHASLFVALGRERFPVATLEDASRIWSRFVDQIARTTGDSGFSHLGNGFPVVDSGNGPVARISYNGRIWPHQNQPQPKEEHKMTKPKTSKKAPAKESKPEAAPAPKQTEAKASAQKKGRARKTPEEDLVVFAFRLTPEERDAIHAAAGPAKASKFVRALSVAAARGDEALVKEMLKGVNPQK